MRDPGDLRKSGAGRRLAVLRAVRGLDQRALAHRAGMGQGAVSDAEQGKRNQEPETRARLLEALRSSPPDLDRAGWLIDGLQGDEGLPGPEGARDLALASLGFALEDRVRAGIALRSAPVAPGGALRDWTFVRELTVEELREIVEDCPELQTTAFLECLCEESEARVRADPQEAHTLARLAFEIAGWIPLADEAQRPACRGFALAFVANTARVQGDLPRSASDFQQAADWWEAGSPAGPDLDGSRLFDMWASLLLGQRSFPAALANLEVALQEGPRRPQAKARILLKKAKVYAELRQPRVALDLLEEAGPLLERDPDPLLVYSHRNLMVGNLWLAGDIEEAERRLPEVQALAAELGNDLDLLRLRWLEAWIDQSAGRRLAAVETMREVRAGFQARRIAYDTALATLELAALLLEQGETAEVKELAVEMHRTFTEQEVPLEAAKAVGIFYEAALRETATVELVRRALEAWRGAPLVGAGA